MTEPFSPARSRSAQLIYTSFDDGAGRGGWQVKQIAGDLDDTERDALVGRVVTRFDLEPRLPDFPTAEQIAARPARLSYGRVEGLGAFWHTVAAGPDASGRPGNVFAHMAVDRATPTDMTYRPIALWGSPDWLRPYGPAEVAAAALPGAELPQANPAMSARAAIDFLTDLHTDRQGVFRVLLDAVVEALATSSSVVLLTRSHEESASWIAAVSHFLPLAATHRLSWTTHDRSDQVAIDIDRGHHLIAVPADSVDERTRFPGAIVIDAAEIPGLAMPGESHRVARGEVEASALSSFVEGILEDPDVALAVLDRRDRVAADVTDPAMVPAWPLAVAVAEHPQLAEFHDDALHVVAFEAPAGVEQIAWAGELLGRAYARHPLTPADTFHPLQRLVRQRQDTAVAATRFLTAVLHDQQWLENQPLNTIPSVGSVDLGALREVISERIGHFVASTESDPVRHAALIIRLTVILYRLGRRDAGFTGVLADLTRAWEAIDISIVWSGHRPANLQDTKAISPVIRAELLRPALLRWPREVLERFDGPAWAWFYDDGSGAPLPPPANPSAADLTLYPIAVASTLQGSALPMSPDQRRAAVTEAVEFALSDPELDDAACRDLTDTLISRHRPDAASMLAWAAREPNRTSPAMLHAAVFYEPPDMGLLADLAHGQNADDDPGLRALVAASRLRLAARDPRQWPQTPALFDDEVAACLADPTGWDYRLAEDLVTMLYAGIVAAQSRRVSFATDPTVTARLTNQPPRSPGGLESTLRIVAQRGFLDLGWVAARSFVARFDSLRPEPVILDRLHRDGTRWSDRLLEWALEENRYPGPTTPIELRDAAWPIVATGTAADAQDFFDEYESRAKDWAKALHLNNSDPSSGRSMIGRFTREDR
ncbi:MULTISPECIES: GAP1-N2 domain-containing protein [Gordonia]|jgi:hypothetical protein|uniref:GAP1-N2 domain-containing protein n=1 Tax=Gordonia TaxID=2053 RepID=UPI0032B49E84